MQSEAVGPEDPQPDNVGLTMAKRLLQSNVKLIAEPSTEQQLKEILKATPMVTAAAGRDGKEYVAIIYDPKLSGESITAPHRRKPPFRFDKFKKLLLATLAARSNEDPKNVQAGDLVIIFDGGRRGLRLPIAITCQTAATTLRNVV